MVTRRKNSENQWKNGGRRGIRTPDQRRVKPLRYRCAIRPSTQQLGLPANERKLKPFVKIGHFLVEGTHCQNDRVIARMKGLGSHKTADLVTGSGFCNSLMVPDLYCI